MNRRRTWYSDNLQSTAGVDTVSYAYDPAAGFLTQLTDLFGHRFTFTYDADARPATVTRFADKGDSAVTETRTYDADGRLRARLQQGKNFTLNQDSLLYNVQNKVIFNYVTHDTVGYNAEMVRGFKTGYAAGISRAPRGCAAGTSGSAVKYA